ncbi:MAG: Hpt domain-containing protein [Chromatiales bacterium]|nr:Hpt domain-containing protein [Chromatiales bacterium]
MAAFPEPNTVQGGASGAVDPVREPLLLVADELAVTLNEARAALEQYAEGEVGNQPLERCAALLHTARGVLQITETWGASLLAEEMEQTCRHLMKSRRDVQADDGIEALSRAAVQLPAYVERIRDGGRDVPLVLLPLLNDLRAARGRPLLSESTLLLLNIAPGALGGTRGAASPRVPVETRPAAGEAAARDAAALAKILRPRFQLALLGWIRGEGGADSLARLQDVVNRLEDASVSEVVHQLWWVTGGVLEALADRGLEAGVSVKRLIGQADREMKRLHSQGERKFAAQPPLELVNNLLYYVARASSSGPRIAAIREAFNLSGLIPGDEQIEVARQSLAAPSVKLMQTVAAAIREDLARVKDVLDIYVRTGMERVEELAPQIDLLKKIGDTLGVLGLGELREVVQTRRTELEALIAGNRQPDEPTLVAMATALLEVEDRLEHQLIGLIAPDSQAGAATPAEHDDADRIVVTQAVMRECLANLARVKEAISLVTERSGDGAALDSIPALLRGITAALLMVERERAGRVAERIATAASEVVQRGAGPEARAALERLADAIVSLEYYMETLQAGRREPGWMLDNAARSLDALVLPEPAVRTDLESAGRVSREDLPATLVIDRPAGGLDVDFPLPETATPPAPARPAAVWPAQAYQGPSADRPVVADTGQSIDPDILELFIEEAREAIEAVNVHFPAWELDEGERESLLTVRRAFHTLKGSGRMVGAELIGEYCWSVEQLLNRVIEGTVPRSPPLVNYLRRAIPAVAELLEQLEVGSKPSSDIRALMAEAVELGRAVAPVEADAPADSADATEVLPAMELDGVLAPAPPPADETLVAQLPPHIPPESVPTLVLGPDDATLVVRLPPAAGPPPVLGPDDATLMAPSLPPAPAMDPVLLDILSREVAVHLGAIREFVAKAGEAVSQPLPESIFRACHTLHGSLTMAGVTSAVEVAAPLNELMGVLHTARLPADADVIAATGETAAVVARIVEQLRAPEPPSPFVAAEVQATVESLTARLNHLVSQAGERAAALSAEAADSGTASMPIPVLTEQDFAAAADEMPEASPWSASPASGRVEGEPAEPGLDLTEVFDVGEMDLGDAGLELEPAAESGPEPVVEPEVAGAGTGAGWDAEVAAIFAEEASEILESCDLAVARLAAREDEAQALAELQRGLHTLKGGARMAGLFAMGDLSHDLETLLLRMADGLLPRAAGTYGLVQAALDELHLLRDEIPAGLAAAPSSALLARLAAGLRGDLVPADEPEVAAELPVAAEPAGLPAEPPAEPVVEAPAPVEDELPEAPGLPDEVHPEILLADLEPEPSPEPAAPAPAAGEPEMPPVDIEPALPPPLPSLAPSIPPALERLGELARELEAPPALQPPSTLLPVTALPPPDTEPARPTAPRERATEPRDVARVDAGLLEQMLNGAGEISIANSRLSQQLAQIQFNLDELNHTVVRLRDQLRKLEIETEAQILHRHQAEPRKETEFDPLELDRYSSIQQLSRGLAETASDVSSIKDLLHNLSADTEGLLVQQARTTTELQDQLMRTRMVPFDQHGSRLARLVRQTAKDQGKLAELSIVGSGDLDRQVLEKMLPPFEHMLRNAVIHGLESPAEREVMGKPPTGSIRIAIRREGAEVVIDIADDGRGLDVAAIRRKAVELGFVSREAALTDEEAMQFILRSGFSTADQLTQAAGRGIGMDVVANQVAKLGGTLSIASQRGKGTTFTLRLPFTLAVTQALIVRAAHELYALPLPTVEGIIRIARSDFEERMARPEPSIEYGGQRYSFRHLGQFLGLGPSRLPAEQERVSIILVRAGENSTALITDEMQDSREIVVKPVGAQLATIRGISGATILGDGRIVVILDVGALVRSSRPSPDAPAPRAEPEQKQTLALVVDDSITMRRVTQRLLERNGFRVVTAKDGVEAISVLQDHRPDIILLDVEMPRMDGYEFARHVRNDAGLAKVPIIMVTSRVSEKHRARAIEIGVNDYLGKPYQERELLEAVQHQLVNR